MTNWPQIIHSLGTSRDGSIVINLVPKNLSPLECRVLAMGEDAKRLNFESKFDVDEGRANAVPAPGFRGFAIEPVPVSTKGFNPISQSPRGRGVPNKPPRIDQ